MRWWQKIDSQLDGWCPLLVPLALLTILKLPSFFEPYWYGDEAIYLTIGTGLRHGERLYATIIDHKTPLIYYLAMVPHQFWFRFLTYLWMAVTTILFFKFAHRWLDDDSTPPQIKSVATFWESWRHFQGGWLATLVFVILTSLPFLEGNIPNGELFVMGWVMLAWWLILPTRLIKLWLEPSSSWPHTLSAAESRRFLLAGLALGGAVLTKVPGLFDAAALFSLPAVLGWHWLTSQSSSHRPPVSHLRYVVSAGVWLAVGLVGAVAASIVYFAARGSLQAYLDYGLLYNFRYAGNWTIPVQDQWVRSLMSLGGKAIISGLALVSLVLWHKRLKPSLWLILAWGWLALFASLLSNRPYAHYFLQLVPAASLLIGYVIKAKSGLFKVTVPTQSLTASQLFAQAAPWFQVSTWLIAVGFALWAVGFGPYPTGSYYLKFGQALTGQISWQQYQQSFNELVADNTVAAELIRQSGDPKLFIWGTNPVLYAQSGTYPTGRFTVSFHIKDFAAQDESVASVVKEQPTFVVMMKNETQSLPSLNSYLHAEYVPNANFKHFVLWKRRSNTD